MGGLAPATSPGWTTADYALIISLCSACVSLISLAWNVWSKFIFPKPKVVVSFVDMTEVSFPQVIGPSGEPMSNLVLSAVNYGPGEVILTGIFGKIRRTRPWHRKVRRTLQSYIDWPNNLKIQGNAAELPLKLAIGERYQVHLAPWPKSKAVVTHLRRMPNMPNQYSDLFSVGFYDAFGRYHWAKRSQFAAALKNKHQP